MTLLQFEERYDDELVRYAQKVKGCNLWQVYKKMDLTEDQNKKVLLELKKFDLNVNVNWPLAHYKSAVRYLVQKSVDVPATGGTNWQKYLPPRFQKRIFFPELWTKNEMDAWGKTWIEDQIKE